MRLKVMWNNVCIFLLALTMTSCLATYHVGERNPSLYNKTKSLADSVTVYSRADSSSHLAVVIPASNVVFKSVVDRHIAGPIYLSENPVPASDGNASQRSFLQQMEELSIDKYEYQSWSVQLRDGRWMLRKGSYSLWEQVPPFDTVRLKQEFQLGQTPISINETSLLKKSRFYCEQAVLYPAAFCVDVITFPVQAVVIVMLLGTGMSASY